MKLEKYSFGIGDRFAHQGEAQLRAIIEANKQGIDIVPVWNKSNREHQIVHSNPADTFSEAQQATNTLNWAKSWYVDADHINKQNVDPFIPHSNFFTLDVADFIASEGKKEDAERFFNIGKDYIGELQIPGIESPYVITEEVLTSIANKFATAIKEASAIYQYILTQKGEGTFVTEVSMDEVDNPQSPVELFFILLGLAHEGVPVQTIAPKFTGRFNKGVDYEGDLNQFRKEFEEDLLVIQYAVSKFNLPENLKLSIHSGSDKFSIYPVMGKLIRKYDAGIHVKTAGTTWLEEIIGLALSGPEALDISIQIYISALMRMNELCKPYATVIDIDKTKLPTADDVEKMTGEQFASTLRHIPDNPAYNPHFRQLIHVGYKMAVEMGETYTDALKMNKETVGKEVTENILNRHIFRLFDINN